MSDTIHITRPQDIDAEPHEVGALAVGQIEALLRAAADQWDELTVQVRSSYQSRVLEDDPDISPTVLLERWDESAVAADLARAKGAVDIALSLCGKAHNRLT
jgi:hypothetical protein